MRISVITPCHNAGRWIAQALGSVAAQTYPAHEVIVVDDASSDHSVAEINRSGVPVTLLHVDVRNAAAARNAGIEAASGDWIALLDADDIWYPNHLARAAELLCGGRDVAFMSSHDWIGLDGELLDVPDAFRCKLTAPRQGLNVEQFLALQEDGFHFGHSTVLYRLDRVRSVGMFDPAQRRRHDSDLWIRMIADQTWTYDSVYSAGYRENTPDSISKFEMECDYFYLRALVKNIDRVPCDAYREHLARQSRRAIGRAFVDAPAEHYTRVRGLAWPHLSPKFRLFYRCASLWPSLARELMTAKRRILRHRASMVESRGPVDR
jgi:glycosyltransferase involved in cell wall biosynthesis